MFRIIQIDHVALTVQDVDRSIAWYRDVLGLDQRNQEVWGNMPAMMYAGETGVALFPAAANGAPGPGSAPTMRHVAFQVNNVNFLRAQSEFRWRGIPFTFEDHKISHSIYLNDPDGYQIELTTYELVNDTA